jgi:hypothetical protein
VKYFNSRTLRQSAVENIVMGSAKREQINE